jgi:hypothetical protein
MSPLIWIIVGVVFVAIIAWRLMIPSLTGVIREALDKHDVTPVIEAVEALKVSMRPTAYNHAIRRIWDAYERELAVDLIKHLARNHNDSLIAQYWLKQLMQVEPALAKRHLSSEFVKRYYQPEVAASCGPVG